MSKIYPEIDPNGLLEYSVVFNDRSLNHMSQRFQGIMRDVSATLKSVYNAAEVALIPGGGTVGMEAIARQFASNKRCLVLRNGWFSYRWSQIFDAGKIPSEHKALLARPTTEGSEAPYAPAPLEEVLAEIRSFQPEIVFATHVETAAGLMLSTSYLQAVAKEVHKTGGLFVVDAIASGAQWLDMRDIGIDILLSAPQKSWSASPSVALIMLGEKAARLLPETVSSSFAIDLGKWRQIMKAYEDGGHAYHATLPTDAIAKLHESMLLMREFGFETLREKQMQLGNKVRRLLLEHGFRSVAAEGYEAPTVVVCYTRDATVHKGSAFAALGLQTAAGVPLACKERTDFQSFRIGLFGLDKLENVDRTVKTLAEALERLRVESSKS